MDKKILMLLTTLFFIRSTTINVDLAFSSRDLGLRHRASRPVAVGVIKKMTTESGRFLTRHMTINCTAVQSDELSDDTRR